MQTLIHAGNDQRDHCIVSYGLVITIWAHIVHLEMLQSQNEGRSTRRLRKHTQVRCENFFLACLCRVIKNCVCALVKQFGSHSTPQNLKRTEHSHNKNTDLFLITDNGKQCARTCSTVKLHSNRHPFSIDF